MGLSPPTDRYRALGLLLAIVASASFVLAGFWATYCVPVVTDGNSTGCVVAHPIAADVATIFGVALLIPAVLFVLTDGALPVSRVGGSSAPSGELPPAAPVSEPRRCGYCGAVTQPPAALCRRCGRPLSWSSPGP